MLLYATLGANWVYGARVTYSFVPDGTNVGGTPSAWFQTMSNRGIGTDAWQQQFQKAAAVWEAVANVNLVLVGDDGSAFSTAGNQQGDPRFGDVRIAGVPQASGVLGLTFEPPPINGGTLAGDIVMNTSQAWQINSSLDIETVAIHEFGHALGLDHSTIQQAVMYASYTGVKQALNSDDVAGIQSVYGTRPGDSFEPNNTYQTATNVNSWIDGSLQVSIPGLSISAPSDTDWFYVVAPAGTTGTMTVKMQSAGLSSLSPRLGVFDTSIHSLGQDSRSGTFGDTAVVTITGVTPGTGYYIRAMAAGLAPTNVGGYGLQVNFTGATQASIPPPNTVVPSQPDRGGGSIGLAVGPVPTFDATNLDLVNWRDFAFGAAVRMQAQIHHGRPPDGAVRVRLGELTARADLDMLVGGSPGSSWPTGAGAPAQGAGKWLYDMILVTPDPAASSGETSGISSLVRRIRGLQVFDPAAIDECLAGWDGN